MVLNELLYNEKCNKMLISGAVKSGNAVESQTLYAYAFKQESVLLICDINALCSYKRVRVKCHVSNTRQRYQIQMTIIKLTFGIFMV